MQRVIDVKVIWHIHFGFLILNMTAHAARSLVLKQARSQLMEKCIHAESVLYLNVFSSIFGCRDKGNYFLKKQTEERNIADSLRYLNNRTKDMSLNGIKNVSFFARFLVARLRYRPDHRISQFLAA